MLCRTQPGTWITAGLLLAVAAWTMPAAAQASNDELRLLLNVPENRLYVYENGKRTQRYRVAIGMEGYETPAGDYRITHAIWNPWWHPPDSDWARGRKPEPPSPDNPMGRVKLHFSPLLYIHGTPEYESLGWAASRGCVRMSNDELIELARFIHERASPRVDEALLDRLVASPKQTRKIMLTKPVPFTVIYRVAEVRDGSLFIFPDVYGMVGDALEDQVLEVLSDSGVDLDTVDREKLHRLVEKGLTRKVSMELETLTAPGNGTAASATTER